MKENRLKKEKKLSNVIHRIDALSKTVCELDHKFPAEPRIMTLYEDILSLKKLLLSRD
jgi:hypothetical protein